MRLQFSLFCFITCLVLNLLGMSAFAGAPQAELSRFFEEQLNHYGSTFNEALISDGPEFIDLEMLGLNLEAGVGFALPWVGKIELRPELEFEWGRDPMNKIEAIK